MWRTDDSKAVITMLLHYMEFILIVFIRSSCECEQTLYSQNDRELTLQCIQHGSNSRSQFWSGCILVGDTIGYNFGFIRKNASCYACKKPFAQIASAQDEEIITGRFWFDKSRCL